jgi:hypothetical protein
VTVRLTLSQGVRFSRRPDLLSVTLRIDLGRQAPSEGGWTTWKRVWILEAYRSELNGKKRYDGDEGRTDDRVSYRTGACSHPGVVPGFLRRRRPTAARVGWLAGGSPPAFRHITEAFLQGMREHRYIDGQNFVLEIRAAEGRFERLSGLAADLVRSKVDVILVGATGPLQAAKDATNTIPIVIASVDPVGPKRHQSSEDVGQGKLKGIKGVGRYSGLREFDPEGKPTRNEYSAEGEYWFKK